MILPDLNNRENHENPRSQEKIFDIILIKMIDLLWDKAVTEFMRTIRECRHCGREFYSIRDEFCSFDCVTQTST